TGRKAGWTIPEVARNQAAAGDSPCLVEGRYLILEEFEFTANGTDPTPIAQWIASRLFPSGDAYGPTRARFSRHFLVLDDDDFTHFARHATEVTARVGLD